MSRARKSIVETFSRAYAAASPDEQAALRVWMRDIMPPKHYSQEVRRKKHDASEHEGQ